MGQVFADPQVVARGMQIMPGGVPGVRSPMSFSGAGLVLSKPAPKLGEHQGEVLGG
jgi:crotonobetainyl-CoA:carnitine CoA-transferase CaiB-like acyl-CoA transferase